MNNEQATEKLRSILKKYNAFIEEDADYWPFVGGMILFKNEDDKKGFAHIGGFGYHRDGSIDCDFESFLADMEKAFKDEYGY